MSQTWYLSHSQSKIWAFNSELNWYHKTLLPCKRIRCYCVLINSHGFHFSLSYSHLNSVISERKQIPWAYLFILRLFWKVLRCVDIAFVLWDFPSALFAWQPSACQPQGPLCSTELHSAPVWILWLSIDRESQLWGQNRRNREISVPNTFHISFNGIDHFIEKKVWIIVLKGFPFEIHILTF